MLLSSSRCFALFSVLSRTLRGLSPEVYGALRGSLDDRGGVSSDHTPGRSSRAMSPPTLSNSARAIPSASAERSTTLLRMDDAVDTDLHWAVQRGDSAAVERLIAAGQPVDEFDEIGKTPLHYAVAAERLDIARVLLVAGAGVDAHDESSIGNTPLGDVAASCSPEVAEFLVAAGADPTIPGWMQLSALDRAAKRKRPEGRRVSEILQTKAAR